MKETITMITAAMAAMMILTSCAASPAASTVSESATTDITISPAATTTVESSSTAGVYSKITPEEAKSLMDKGNVTVLDVRTLDEYNAGHIADAVRLEMADFAAKLATVLPDKDAVILVYCRSGNRSKTASGLLIEAGYTHVYDFGGIIDWPYDVGT